jgi:hypothetical protein
LEELISVYCDDANQNNFHTKSIRRARNRAGPGPARLFSRLNPGDPGRAGCVLQLSPGRPGPGRVRPSAEPGATRAGPGSLEPRTRPGPGPSRVLTGLQINSAGSNVVSPA